MFAHEANFARSKLQSGAFTFARKGGGFWYPDTLADRNAAVLLGVHGYKTTKSADEIIALFKGLDVGIEFLGE